MTEEREMTALDAPVGAGAEQSLNNYTGIISDYGEDFNPSAEEMFEAHMQYEQEVQALSAEHAKQLMDAQQAVDEASRNYEKALDLCDDARKAAL